MNRITRTFENLKKQGRKGLVGYLTAGDPDVQRSDANLLLAVEQGVDVLEIGVPFSDPTADGPEIQEASQRALAAGMTLGKALDMVRRLRRKSEAPVVLFGYVNPFFRYGYEKLARDAAEAGVDAFLVVDLPYEESGEFRQALQRYGLFLIPLIAPTTPKDRAAMILKEGGGFVYYIMVRGVTGARAAVAEDLAGHVGMLREVTSLPLAVGFGVSSGAQAREAAQAADAVVVGSALVRAARENRLEGFVREIRQALDAGCR